MPIEKKMQIYKSEESSIDRDFKSIRDKFDDEMRKMEDEMSRFRSKMMDREREVGSLSRSLTPTSRSRELTSWIDDFDSPLIKESSDGKALKLKFDVTQYEPEEIVVKTVDNRLQVHAKHEEKTDTRKVFREYNREFLLPEGTNPELIKSSLSRDGVLTVEAPLPKALQDTTARKIPIEKA